jgi:glycosyltransferase involved in cell wall biosynthesis
MGQTTVSDQEPLISVVVPAYNAERFIARTLQSVIAQSYAHFEVWVVDDGSTDQTAAIAREIAQQDPRVKILVQANAGVAAARNLAIQQANGDWIAPIDADDLWNCDYLKQVVDCINTAPKAVGLIYAWSLDIDEQDCPTGGFHAAQIAGRVYSTLLCHNFLGNASCTVMRRDCLLAIGGYSEQFQAQNAYGCEDWDLYLRLATRCEFAVVPEFRVSYRKLRHSMSDNADRMARSHALMLQRVQQCYPELPAFLYRLSRSSLYLYFAHHFSAQQNPHRTLYWLRQAMQADLSPWLRLGTYGLGLKSLGQFGMLRRSHQTQPDLHADSVVAPFAKTPSRWQVAFKILVGNLLHSRLGRYDGPGFVCSTLVSQE